MSGMVASVSQRLTAWGEMESASASCSCVISAFLRKVFMVFPNDMIVLPFKKLGGTFPAYMITFSKNFVHLSFIEKKSTLS